MFGLLRSLFTGPAARRTARSASCRLGLEGLGASTSVSPRRPLTSRPEVEHLESRVVLSAAGSLSGATFSLQQGNLYEIAGSSRKLIATNVQGYAWGTLGGTNYVFDLTNTGAVKDFDGRHWTTLTGSKPSVSQITAFNGHLYMVAHNGGDNDSVWQYGGKGTSWATLTSPDFNVSEIWGLNGHLVMVGANGGTNGVWQYSGKGTNWAALTGADANVSHIDVVNGRLYMAADNGTNQDTVWRYNGSGTSWTAVTGPNTSVSQIGAYNGHLVMVGTNGGNNSVWQYSGSGTNWAALTGPNTQVYELVVANSSLEMVATNGGAPSVWRYTGSGTRWAPLTGAALRNELASWSLAAKHPAADMAYSPATGALFGDGGPSYQDVQQAGLADCWLLASLAETAARAPADITSMFLFDGSTVENGSPVDVYSVHFYDRSGVAHYVTVDTELPAAGYCYDHPVNNVLWVALAEKAYAEANAAGYVTTRTVGANSYNATNYGDPTWALRAITGQKVVVNEGDLASAWQDGGLIVLSSTDFGNSPASSDGVYIVPNHAYAVVDYDPTTGAFTLFNPWGVGGGFMPLPNGNLVFFGGTVTETAEQLATDFGWFAIGAGGAPGRAANDLAAHTPTGHEAADLLFASGEAQSLGHRLESTIG
jgi:hypothetical protein